MDQYFDISEVQSDHSVMWRCGFKGTQVALATLKTIGKQTSSECLAINRLTEEIVGRVNINA